MIHMANTLKIGIVGGTGWLAQTLIKAMLAKGVVAATELGVSYRNTPPQDFTPGLATTDSQELADRADVIMLSVRPADFKALRINAHGKLVISVMAGVPLSQITEAAQTNRVVRAMPNVAASVGYSYTPWVASTAATPTDRGTVARIFDACGLCDEVAHEAHLDYLTGLTGSGPAYPALLAAALSADAIRQGIAPAVARRAVAQLLVGTGRLLEQESRSMDAIVQDFVDYRGVIAAAIIAMREAGFDASVQSGLAAAAQKTEALR